MTGFYGYHLMKTFENEFLFCLIFPKYPWLSSTLLSRNIYMNSFTLHNIILGRDVLF